MMPRLVLTIGHHPSTVVYIQNKLWNVLVSGRFSPVALSEDLQKAFSQVCIKANDLDALRFYWQESAGVKVESLRFTRALFGL